MKKYFLLLLILILPIVAAEEVTINLGDSVSVSNKTLTLEQLLEGKAVISVDEVSRILQLNKTEEVNGLKLKLIYTEIWSTEDKFAKFFINESLGSITVIRCGDDICSTGEENTCCTDCECNDGFSCVEDSCVRNECNDDSECGDTDPCTNDLCEGEPKKCTNEPKTSCESHDDCCPVNCYYPDDGNCPKDKTEDNPNWEGDEVVDDSFSENLEDNPPEPLEPKQEGFFSSIINWFLSLFR